MLLLLASRSRTVSIRMGECQTYLSEDDFLSHFVKCQQARRVFIERFGKLNGGELLLKARDICDVAGDMTAVDSKSQSRVLDRVMWMDVNKHIEIREELGKGFDAL